MSLVQSINKGHIYIPSAVKGLTPLSAIFFVYHGNQFLVVEEAGIPGENTDHGQATGKLYHLRLQVECTLYVIYKGGCELMPY